MNKQVIIKDYFLLGREEPPKWMLEAIESGYCDYFFTNNYDNKWISKGIIIHIVTMKGVIKINNGERIAIEDNGQIIKLEKEDGLV